MKKQSDFDCPSSGCQAHGLILVAEDVDLQESYYTCEECGGEYTHCWSVNFFADGHPEEVALAK